MVLYSAQIHNPTNNHHYNEYLGVCSAPHACDRLVAIRSLLVTILIVVQLRLYLVLYDIIYNIIYILLSATSYYNYNSIA
jgi:hypothetical protein